MRDEADNETRKDTAKAPTFPGFSRLLKQANATQKPDCCHAAPPPSIKVTADGAGRKAAFPGQVFGRLLLERLLCSSDSV